MISGPRSQQIIVDQRSEALPGFKTLPVLDYSEATRHRQRLGRFRATATLLCK
jgi:hypothetical protein